MAMTTMKRLKTQGRTKYKRRQKILYDQLALLLPIIQQFDTGLDEKLLGQRRGNSNQRPLGTMTVAVK